VDRSNEAVGPVVELTIGNRVATKVGGAVRGASLAQPKREAARKKQAHKNKHMYVRSGFVFMRDRCLRLF